MIELFLEELLEWLPHLEKAVDLPNNRSSKAVVRSVIAELYLHWIRPCDQGNARLSGSFWAHALHRSGLPEALGHIASDHYLRHFADLQRIAHAAADPSADPMPFLLFSLRGIADGLQDLHRRIRGLQFNGQWRAQLLDLFREANDAPTRRQRQLLLDLGENDAAVHLPRLPLLTPELAALYAGVSEKTLRRDVDALLAAGVLLRSAEGLHVDRSSILAFKGRAPIPDDPGSDRPL